MAKFVYISEKESFVNIELISSMYYDKEKNITYIHFSRDDYFTLDGDHIEEISKFNDTVSMHEKLVSRYWLKDIKSLFFDLIRVIKGGR